MQRHRGEIRFLLNDRQVTLHDVRADAMLLDHLRLVRGLTGTKEGCAEGDCGACTVLVGRSRDDTVDYEPVNACIRFLASVDGCHVVTVEHLGAGGTLRPVQRAMVDHNASQCGFCTPGFVMALQALWMRTPTPTVTQAETALQGNLCRCTGYAPILRAALDASAHGNPADDPLVALGPELAPRLAELRDGRRVVCGEGRNAVILPCSGDDLAEVLAETPGATLIAGATDVGLWVTKELRDVGPAVFIGHLEDLAAVEVTSRDVTLGAVASYTGAEAALTGAFPHLTDYWTRIGGWQVRNMGTIGGNIANGSPIGDTPPPLIAMGAEITLRSARGRRVLALEDFFLGYGRQDRAPDEFLETIRIPRPEAGRIDAAYKISKRRDEDISALAAGLSVLVRDGIIIRARIAFGGMAATPARARAAEAALEGQPWTEASLVAAGAALTDDFAPISDWRASAEYRMLAARNLLRRFYLEQQAPGGGRTVRLDGVRETG